MPRLNMGIDAVGPKVRDTGPNDTEKVNPEDLRECEGCRHAKLCENGMDLGDYGWWCYKCLDERLTWR